MRLSRRWTSVKIILSSSRLISVRRLSIKVRAAEFWSVSSCLEIISRGRIRRNETYSATSRVSRLCFKNIRFSFFAHSMLSLSVFIWTCWLSGIELKKSNRVRTIQKWICVGVQIQSTDLISPSWLSLSMTWKLEIVWWLLPDAPHFYQSLDESVDKSIHLLTSGHGIAHPTSPMPSPDLADFGFDHSPSPSMLQNRI